MFKNSLYIFLGLITFCNFIFDVEAVKSKPLFPIAIKDQLSNADGVIIASFQGSSNAKDRDGQVTTVGSFFIEKVAGIPDKNILNRYSFRVEYPGGNWQGVRYKVKESPEFIKGEKVVLILKKGKFGYELPHQALSKFNFKKVDGELYLYSKFFQGKRGVGIISWNDFNKIVENEFGMRVGSYVNNQINTNGPTLISSRAKKNRRPASSLQTDKGEENYKVETYWLVLIMGVLGGLISIFGRFTEEE